MSLATAFDNANILGFCSGSEMEFQAEVRIKMAQTVEAIVLKLVTEVAAYRFIIQQAVLRELCGMLDPHTFDFVSDGGELNEVMTAALQGFGNEATSLKCADLSGKKLWEATLDQLIRIATSVKKENCGCIIGDTSGFNEGRTSLVEELPRSAEVDVIEALKQVATVGDGARSNDDFSPENGSVQNTDGIANWVLTAAKGKEQDDDDVDDEDDDDEDDDGDDDDYEEEADDDNDNKIEPADDEEDVEGEDEEGDDEAGEEDGDDDGEAEDNGEAQDDDGEEGEEEDDVEGDEDGDEDGDEEPEDEDGEEEDPEDEDEDEVEGESEEDIEDLEPPKKKRK